MKKIRICTCSNFHYVNTQINIEKFPLLTYDEMINILGNNKIFSSIDLENAYLQLPIESSDLLVITTNKGLFRYRQLPFWLASSPGIFQIYLQQMFTNIKGVCISLDNILVCGSTTDEHENRLLLVLDKLSESNIKINKKKCQINKDKLEFMGHTISRVGVSPN